MDRLKVSDGAFQLEFPARGKHSIVLLYKGEKVFSYGRVHCGKFSEVGALEKKFRIHPNQDGLSAEIETANVIPFGCEYEISRDINAASRFLRITDDIRAVNFGRVGDVTLEEVRFPADFVSVEYLIYGESSMRKTGKTGAAEIFKGNEPVVMLTVTLKNAVKIDFGCGSDIWRLRSAAGMEEVSAEFSVTVEDDELILRRRPLIYAEGADIEQRPWRFKSIVSWKEVDGESSTLPDGTEEFSNAPCMIAPVARREFRRKIRRSQNDLVCSASVPGLCNDASHLEKPVKGELCHFDLEEYITSYVWANRQLGKQGKKFAFAFNENIFSSTAAVENLSQCINSLEFEDTDF